MEPVNVNFLKDAGIGADILIEGLPGVGQVGKLVAEHIIHELDAEKIAEIYSQYFPPQVLIDEEGVVRLVRNEIYRYDNGEKQILFLVGDCQSTSAEGHYHLTECYLDIAERLGVKVIYTLGGYGVGHLVDEPRVLSAVNTPGLRKTVEEAGAIFEREEPGGGIIGASGLLLGLGTLRGMKGVCLMAETSGYLVDPKSAGSLLSVLTKLTGLEVSPTTLQNRATEMELMITKLREAEHARQNEELTYIG